MSKSKSAGLTHQETELVGCEGIPIRRLRIHVTSRCNYKCFFCHHEGLTPDSHNEMSVEEIRSLVEVASEIGVTSVKLVGGEALVRDDLEEIVQTVSPLVEDVSLTTNGLGLAKRAQDLKDAGLDRVNISLHTLDSHRYHQVTGRDTHYEILDSIDAALNAGLTPVKVNVVLLRNLNLDELKPIVEFCREKSLTLQFLELSPSDSLSEEEFNRFYFDGRDLQQLIDVQLEKTAKTMEVCKEEIATEDKYHPMKVELRRLCNDVTACAGSGSLQVTSEGHLKPCFWRNDNLIDIRKALQNSSHNEIKQSLLDAGSYVRSTCNFEKRK